MSLTTYSTASCLLGLYAVTPLHPGASGARGEIDLPVQKEAHTGWPVCFASGMKGAWREAADNQMTANDVCAVFGSTHKSTAISDTDETQVASQAGALAVTDAQILLLPVRSLSSTFKWITSPAVLKRFIDTCDLVGLARLTDGLTAPSVEGENALSTQESSQSHVLLEEFSFALTAYDLSPWVALLSELSGQSIERIERDLLVVSDDVFTYYCEFGLEVQAHVRLNSGTKTAIDGALWWEETLSRDTLLYSTPVAFGALNMNSKDILNAALDVIGKQNNLLRLGGNQSLGMGWCKVMPLHMPTQKA